MLGTESRFSVKEAYVCNHWAIFPAPPMPLFVESVTKLEFSVCWLIFILVLRRVPRRPSVLARGLVNTWMSEHTYLIEHFQHWLYRGCTCRDVGGRKAICSSIPCLATTWSITAKKTCVRKLRISQCLDWLEVNYPINRDIEAFYSGIMYEKQAYQGSCCHHRDGVRQVLGNSVLWGVMEGLARTQQRSGPVSMQK